MKKTFQLHVEGKNPDRVLDRVKHDVRKYLKRERSRALPEGVDLLLVNSGPSMGARFAVDVDPLTAGRSDMREILLREERAINARLAVVEQQVAWSKADVLLEAAQGQLLDRWR